MATTFKIAVRKRRKDGLWPVYVRVTHNRKVEYVKTDKLVSDRGLSSKMEVTDPVVVLACQKRIVEYADALNRVESSQWTIREVVDYLKRGDADVSFSEYARLHISRLINNGQERTSRNYKLALQHLERYIGTTKVMFSMLTSTMLNSWIKSLEGTARAKEMYPVCMRQVWRAAERELNDEERGVIRIKFNPWLKVGIPQGDTAKKRAITPEACRRFFSAPLPESKMVSPLPELGRDVAMMVLCLGGMNTVDIYNLRKEDYHGGILYYRRAKTMRSRADGAYMEMRVPEILLPLMEKYRTGDDDPWLFSFHGRHTTSDSFSANVNIGIKKICKSMGMAKEDWYCVYTFRHTWGTVAQNDCGASIAEVAFGMNHSAGHRVTRGYLKLNFEPAWRLNEKVVEMIFFSDRASRRDEQDSQERAPFRFRAKHLMRGIVFFRGRALGKVEDIGFNNVQEVIDTLVPYIPDDVPQRSMLQFRIENLDKGETAVYERMRGKGC